MQMLVRYLAIYNGGKNILTCYRRTLWKNCYYLFSLFRYLCFFLSAQSTETSESLKFIESSVKAGNATIDFSFNDLTGVLRLTYTLEVFTFDVTEADRLIRDEVVNLPKSMDILSITCIQRKTISAILQKHEQPDIKNFTSCTTKLV